jgi:hypothetical protein
MARDRAITRSGRDARRTDPGLRVRLALGVLGALVLLADATGSGQLQLSRELARTGATKGTVRCGEVDCGAHVARLDAVLGAAASVPAPRFERAGPGDDWTATRLHAEVHAVIRQFGLSAWRQRHGHVSDRPLISTLPARGPPATA